MLSQTGPETESKSSVQRAQPPSCRMDSGSVEEDDDSSSGTNADACAELTRTWLAHRAQYTRQLLDEPYDLLLYVRRALVYRNLGYPDLAAGDAYRALLLTDEVCDESFEYHEQAVAALTPYLPTAGEVPNLLPQLATGSESFEAASDAVERLNIRGAENEEEDEGATEAALVRLAKRAALRCYQILSLSLLLCGCLRSAQDFCRKGLSLVPNDEELLQTEGYVRGLAKTRLNRDDFELSDLPDQGLVRREVYPWNEHEPDRFSKETLDMLNVQLATVAPKCVVKVAVLPTLRVASLDSDDENDDETPSTNKQLGLFAKADIAPAEIILDEKSVLTANNRLKDSLCDTCSIALPPLGAENPPVACDGCSDIMFCSQACHDFAQEKYHPAVCDKDIDTIAKDPDAKETPDALYLLLLARALAMACHQDVHPLDIDEVKYIWGDFLPSKSNDVPGSPTAGPPPIWTLPFSFYSNIAGPLHVLEKMDVDVFATLPFHDQWVLNTLYAKFRGTASARVSTIDGRPEVAAVHPLWCLANHDCDPNVQWEWGGHMKLWARETRPYNDKPGGIRAGEEILNHYCDIDLPVQARREWAMGSLGGNCMCERCKRESALERGSTVMV